MPKKIPNKIDRRLGRDIKAERERQGLSLAQLGKKIGVAHNAVYKYERGETPITVARLHAIADALGHDIIYFLIGL